MSQELTVTDPIALNKDDRVTAIAERTTFGVTGGIAVDSLPQVVDFAKLMCQAKQGVPKPFRNEPGLCLAVAMQALRWGMDPFGVCQNAYVVNDKVAYEAKVIKAAIDQNAPLTEPLDFTYTGSGDTRVCVCIGKFRNAEGNIVSRLYETPQLGKIHPKNSPLWKTDPDQQLAYFAARAWGRRHTPGVMLGVVSRDELQDQGSMINAAPVASSGMAKRFLSSPDTVETVHEDQSDTAPDASAVEGFAVNAADFDDLAVLGEAFDELQQSEDWAQATEEQQRAAHEAHSARARELLADEAQDTADDTSEQEKAA